MPTTFARTGDFPKCNNCKNTLDWWDLREDESTYECNGCASKKRVEQIEKNMKELFKEMYPNGRI